jgi:hypothetical protein
MRFSPQNKNRSKKNLALAFAALAALALGACDDSSSPTQSTSTARIIFKSPTAGQTLHVGDVLHVTWTTKDDVNDPFNGVEVSLSPDGGKTWAALHNNSIAPGSAQWEKFDWKITPKLYIQAKDDSVALAGSADCKVKVAQYSTQDPDKIVTSASFSIAP